MVGKYITDELIAGFRIINIETLKTEDITIAKAVERVRDITNLKMGNNDEIIGGSGKLDRYGVVNGSDKKYTVLCIVKKHDKIIGYCISDNDGNIKTVSVNTLNALYRNGKITNCRINVNGLSLVKGAFPVIEYKDLIVILGKGR